MLTKDEAICIRASDYSETSQIVTFFAKAAGKISAIAKGSKRPKSPFGGPIEILSYGKIVFSDTKRERLATLTEFEQQSGFETLQSNVFALNCSVFGVELVNKLTDDYDPHPELFDSFLQFLKSTRETSRSAGRLTAESRETISLLILFQLSLLKEIGLQPVLKSCANCKTTFSTDWPKCYFSSAANGLICRDCEGSFPDKISVTKTAANCLAKLKLIAQADEKTRNEIEKVLVYHFTELLHRPPKMAKYILM
jgi:DNA repair protein RecO (recombination protein O)